VDPDRHCEQLLAAWGSAPDEAAWTYLFAERPAIAAACRAALQAMAASSDPIYFAVVDAASGAALGTLSFMRIEPAHGVLEVGHLSFSPALQRSRLSTEAIALLLARAFACGWRRVEWKCDSLNAPSCSAALRYGFTYEGLFRQAIVYKGRSRDTAWFSMLDRDWPRVQAALAAWLAPENFDEQGRQRQKLQARVV
jgi:RimJ/RimL family protein N-acetyltransferase